jgi:Restriction endonuclease
MPKGSRSFTYGAQFEADQYDLVQIIQLCQKFEPDRAKLEEAIHDLHTQKGLYPSATFDNRKKLAMNTFLSLKAYGIIESKKGQTIFQVTEFSRTLLEASQKSTTAKEAQEQVAKTFATHILRNLDGMSLLKAVEAIEAREEVPNLELIAEELREQGLHVASNSVYMSTMRNWLAKAKVFRDKGYEVNWDIVYDLLGVNRDELEDLYELTSSQKYYLLSLISLNGIKFLSSNDVAEHVRSVFKVRITAKNLKKDVLDGLATKGLIEIEKTTQGRGAKPFLVRLTSKVEIEVIEPLIKKLAEQTGLTFAELNLSFDRVIENLASPNKHVAGKALELLAIWMIRITSLRFTKWRKRDEETGQGEVDVLAASDRLVYSRWQIQCKNIPNKPVDVDVIAKEVGMTFVTGADVVMVVTTGRFTSSAVAYAYRMMNVSRYYVILLEKDDIEEISRDLTNIVRILDRKARRVFIKKELGASDEQTEQILEEIVAEEYLSDLEEPFLDDPYLLEQS